ncbi:hypothetical protein G4177_05375 [Corallococcus sp. ZKHCc1 1396]|uniref:Lipoprotein n=1 Tax=Corallococcus soli TaxID=2710757 RepID=A0ABR9PI72_9BACT|nr:MULTISPECIES: hypothetical protein [Corallococcus]MBE4747611.1 hypothetical protein [Corallococcus soli]MCY1035535.1 hypothetical protein [Corallococcus sp. BB11-1]RYZ35874.1 MAG: hypothetical protein EOO72_11745 [Myxococcaceae bacterium]
MRLRNLWLPLTIIALSGCGDEVEELQDTPQLLIDRTELSFDTEFAAGTYVGATTFNTLYLENRGIQTLELNEASLSGPGVFTMKKPENWPENGPMKLETYQRTFIEVAFKPNAARDFEGKLTIKSNAANGDTRELLLKGKGIAP